MVDSTISSADEQTDDDNSESESEDSEVVVIDRS